MSTKFNRFLSNLVLILPNLLLISIIFNGCHYCSPEGEEMRPLIEIRNEINELEKRKISTELDLKEESKINKQKRDSLAFINSEIEKLEKLINEFEK